MGFLRFILAVGVLVHHSGSGVKIMNGGFAVEIFFIISGFYMALILDEKYRNKTSLFFSNRALRIFPLYFIVLVMQVGVIVLFDAGHSISKEVFLGFFSNPNIDNLLIISTNLFIFGQEVMSFFSQLGNGTLVYDPSQQTGDPAWKLLLIPQAWSISMELGFYLFAPMVMRSWKVVFAVFVLFFILHSTIIFLDYPYNSWGRRFFLSEASFFLLGMLSYLGSRDARVWIERSISRSCVWGLLAVLLVLLYVNRDPTFHVRLFVYPAISIYVAFLLPVLFYAVRSSLDRLVGELSYPIYLTHWLILGVLVKSGISSGARLFLATILTIGVSYVLYRYIDVPLDRFRQKRL